jgi:magnesium transporter
VRRRLRADKGPIRRSGSDYLAYALIDAALDGFYPVVEAVGDRLHELEEQILVRPTNATLHRVHAQRRELLALRRAVWPQREAIAALMHDSNEFVTDDVRNYLRDCHVHAVQIVDVIETFREFAGNLMDMYMSSVSLRTNDVMKVLTIMASIFIPLTFLAGIYGMNFDHLPELHLRWGYFAVLGVMAAVGVAMLVFFYRRGWIGSRDSGDDGSR